MTSQEVFAQYLRLSRVLRQLMEQEKFNNPHRLHTAIVKANKAARTNCTIGKATLVKIISQPTDPSLCLSMENFVALHVFLRPFGEGFDQHPLLEKSGVLDWLSRSRALAWLLASKPQHKQDFVSSWDLYSVVELQNTLNGLDAKFEHGKDLVMFRPWHKQDRVDQRKLHDMVQADNASLVSIGSPLACCASELILATMFGVTPFERPSPGRPVPFYFCWPPHCTPKLRSSFALSPEELSSATLAGEIRDRKASALKVDQNDYLRVPMGKSRYTLYGTITAQRRRNNNVWLVLSGLSGPATLAAARAAKDIAMALPALPGKNSSILWAIVQAEISHRRSDNDEGDGRTIESCKLVGEPRIWPVKD